MNIEVTPEEIGKQNAKNIHIMNYTVLILYTIIYVYMVFTDPFKRTPQTIFFNILFLIIPWLTLLVVPKFIPLGTGQTADANFDAVLGQLLPVIAAVAVLGTFFLSRETNDTRYIILTKYLLFSFIFTIIAIIPIFTDKPQNYRLLYQLNLRIVAGACAICFIGRAIYSLIEKY